MGQDNGLDAQLPISREGLLAALDTAINQAVAFRRLISEAREHTNNRFIYARTDLSVTEIDAHIQYLRLLSDNILEDRRNNYPPVVRKRFKHDETLI